LDEESRFNLALGRPVTGTYRVSALTRKETLLNGSQEGWLRAPELVITIDSLPRPQQVRVQDFDEERLLLLGFPIVAAQAACLIFWYRLPRRKHTPVSDSSA
jgi:hypothetical protein